MKKIKKALMGITALVMAFSMTAMTACDTGSNPENNKKPDTEQTDPTKPGGDDTDPTKPGGDDTDPTKPGGETPAKTDAEKIMDASAAQTVGGMTTNIAVKAAVTEATYDSDAEGNKLESATEEKEYSKGTITIDGAVDLSTMNVDASMEMLSYYVDEKGAKIPDSDQNMYNYSYVRDGYTFNYSGETKVTDFSKVVFGMEAPTQDESLVVTGVEGVSLNPIIYLGKAYEANSFANKKLTINLNKVVHGLYTDVLEEIEGLTETTKIGEIIESAPVKNLIDALTYGVTAKDIYDAVIAQLPEMPEDPSQMDQQTAMVMAIVGLIPVPEEGASVHAYLVSVLKNKEFLDSIMSMINPEAPSMGMAMYDFAVIDIINMLMSMGGGSEQNPGGSGSTEQTPEAGGNASTLAETDAGSQPGEVPQMTMEQIKLMVKGLLAQYVNVTEDKVTVNVEYTTVEVSALQMVFAVNDNYEIVSTEITGNVAVENITIRGNGISPETMTYMTYVETVEAELKATIAFNETVTLKDISGYKVAQVSYAYPEKSEETLLLTWQKASNQKIYYRAYSTIANGEVEVIIYSRNGNNNATSTVKTITESGSYDITVNGTTYTFDVEIVDKGSNIGIDNMDGYIYISINNFMCEDKVVEDQEIRNGYADLSLDKERHDTETTVGAVLAATETVNA